MFKQDSRRRFRDATNPCLYCQFVSHSDVAEVVISL